MKLVLAILQPSRLSDVVDALQALPGVGAITVTDCRGYGRRRGPDRLGEVRAPGSVHAVDRVKLELVVPDGQVGAVLQAVHQHARTGRVGDGKVFVLPVEDALRIRTGDRGEAAL
ncbi:P-II family nitrogen regulator [Myxococcota bacterium]|nr:P-II family nitrogen regulator [Myxococcota bacterium]